MTEEVAQATASALRQCLLALQSLAEAETLLGRAILGLPSHLAPPGGGPFYPQVSRSLPQGLETDSGSVGRENLPNSALYTTAFALSRSVVDPRRMFENAQAV